MAQTQGSKSDGKTHVMETRKRAVPAHMSPQTSTEMTYDDPNSPSLEATATHFLLEFGVTKGFTIHTLTHMTRQQLSEILRDFYGKLKSRLEDQPIGMKELREGLHRYFMREMAVDIIRDKTFELANATFDIAFRSSASGSRKCHRMRIEMEDLRKIYFGDAMDLSKPDSLQNKVFFDVNLYICNRSKDHLRLMKKDDFEVSSDVTGKRYVWLKEHPKFSTGTDKEFDGYQVGDRMVERPGRCSLVIPKFRVVRQFYQSLMLNLPLFLCAACWTLVASGRVILFLLQTPVV